MDKSEILEIVLRQLPVKDQLSCTLVSRQWHLVARSIIRRYHLARFEDQLDSLRCFSLNRTTTSPSSTYFHSLHLLSNLVSLTVAPDARIHPDEFNKRTGLHDPLQFCLTGLLPKLDKLKHLYIHGQDLRWRPNGRDTESQLGGTDAALLALAASRRSKNLPGLETLSIISSPDLTDEGLIGYLSTTLLDHDETSTEHDAVEDVYALGNSHSSLTLVNCPLLTVQSLAARDKHCRNLVQLTLREVDGFFELATTSDAGEVKAPEEIFANFIRDNASMRTFSFSSNLSILPTNLFSAFNSPSNKLQSLDIHPSRSLQRHHLSSFPSIHRLTVTGCSKLGDDLPFECMPNLQELSFLGRGLSLSSLWRLFQNKQIRKLTLDVAGSAYETCICADSTSSSEDARQEASIGSLGNRDRALEPFPHVLETFKNQNILSSTIPPWVVAFFLSCSPSSMDSISLHGAMVPTCCSMRSFPPPPALNMPAYQPMISPHSSYHFTYWSLFKPNIHPSYLFRSIMEWIPPATRQRIIGASRHIIGRSNSEGSDGASINTIHDSAASALAKLSFETLRGLVPASQSCPLPERQGEEGGEIPSTAPGFDVIEAIASKSGDYASDMDHPADQAPSPGRRRRTQSISGDSSRSRKAVRRALQRSASEFVSNRSCDSSYTTSHAARSQSTDRSMWNDCHETAAPVRSGLKADVAVPSHATVSDEVVQDDTARPQLAAQALSAREVSLLELLSVSTIDASAPPPTFSHYGNVGTSRLNPQQVEWLHEAVQGRIVRLEL